MSAFTNDELLPPPRRQPPSTAEILAVLHAAAEALDPDAPALVRMARPLARDACERLAAQLKAARCR